MDENFVETAERLALAEVAAGIERSRARLPAPAGFDGTCACGAEINPRRVDLGYYRCLDCQTIIEKRQG